MDRCGRCKELRLDPLACKCELFQAQDDHSPESAPWSRQPDEGNWSDVYARDAESAAEKFAERSDCEGDYTIVRHGDGRLWVRNAVNEVTRWNIEAESVPTYYAHEVRPVSEEAKHG